MFSLRIPIWTMPLGCSGHVCLPAAASIAAIPALLSRVNVSDAARHAVLPDVHACTTASNEVCLVWNSRMTLLNSTSTTVRVRTLREPLGTESW